MESSQYRMTFLEHLEEFRWTVCRSLIAFIVGAGAISLFLPQVGDFLQVPLQKAYVANGLAYTQLISYKPMGVFSVFIQITLLGGLVLSMPFVLYFTACFILPGLTDRERRIVRPVCFTAFVLFVLGVCAAYYILLPMTYTMMVYFNEKMGQALFWAASEYYNNVVWFSIATGVVFQFPLVLIVLIYTQILTVAKLKAVRKLVFVGILIASALLTPGGDPLSLSLVTAILYGLYELSLIVGARLERKARARELREWDDEVTNE